MYLLPRQHKSNNAYVDLDDYYGGTGSGGSCAYIVLNPRNLRDSDPTRRLRGSVNSVSNEGFRGGTPNSSVDLEWEVDGTLKNGIRTK